MEHVSFTFKAEPFDTEDEDLINKALDEISSFGFGVSNGEYTIDFFEPIESRDEIAFVILDAAYVMHRIGFEIIEVDADDPPMLTTEDGELMPIVFTE